MKWNGHGHLFLNHFDHEVIKDHARDGVLEAVIDASDLEHAQCQMEEIVICGRQSSRLIIRENPIVFDAHRHDVVIADDGIGVLRISLGFPNELLSVLAAFLDQGRPVVGELGGVVLHLLKPHTHEIGGLFKRMEGENYKMRMRIGKIEHLHLLTNSLL